MARLKRLLRRRPSRYNRAAQAARSDVDQWEWGCEGDQVNRIAEAALKRGKSVDFTGYL
jgi:hypothetical protein